MTAHHTTGRTGGISQDAVKLTTSGLRKRIRIGGITHHNLGLQSKSSKVFLDTLTTQWIDIHSKQLAIHALQHMRRLATGRSAGIQNPHARLHVQQNCRQLRTSVLYRKFTFGEARQTRYSDGSR